MESSLLNVSAQILALGLDVFALISSILVFHRRVVGSFQASFLFLAAFSLFLTDVALLIYTLQPNSDDISSFVSIGISAWPLTLALASLFNLYVTLSRMAFVFENYAQVRAFWGLVFGLAAVAILVLSYGSRIRTGIMTLASFVGFISTCSWLSYTVHLRPHPAVKREGIKRTDTQFVLTVLAWLAFYVLIILFEDNSPLPGVTIVGAISVLLEIYLPFRSDVLIPKESSSSCNSAIPEFFGASSRGDSRSRTPLPQPPQPQLSSKPIKRPSRPAYQSSPSKGSDSTRRSSRSDRVQSPQSLSPETPRSILRNDASNYSPQPARPPRPSRLEIQSIDLNQQSKESMNLQGSENDKPTNPLDWSPVMPLTRKWT